MLHKTHIDFQGLHIHNILINFLKKTSALFFNDQTYIYILYLNIITEKYILITLYNLNVLLNVQFFKTFIYLYMKIQLKFNQDMTF